MHALRMHALAHDYESASKGICLRTPTCLCRTPPTLLTAKQQLIKYLACEECLRVVAAPFPGAHEKAGGRLRPRDRLGGHGCGAQSAEDHMQNTREATAAGVGWREQLCRQPRVNMNEQEGPTIDKDGQTAVGL